MTSDEWPAGVEVPFVICIHPATRGLNSALHAIANPLPACLTARLEFVCHMD
jgi:hypothetical protein